MFIFGLESESINYQGERLVTVRIMARGCFGVNGISTAIVRSVD